MVDDAGSPRRIARVLSGVLQAVIADEIGGQDAASSAFLMEFRDEIERAQKCGATVLVDAYQDLLVDMAAALFSVTKYTAQKAGDDPRITLETLIRTYRKASSI